MYKQQLGKQGAGTAPGWGGRGTPRKGAGWLKVWSIREQAGLKAVSRDVGYGSDEPTVWGPGQGAVRPGPHPPCPALNHRKAGAGSCIRIRPWGGGAPGDGQSPEHVSASCGILAWLFSMAPSLHLSGYPGPRVPVTMVPPLVPLAQGGTSAPVTGLWAASAPCPSVTSSLQRSPLCSALAWPISQVDPAHDSSTKTLDFIFSWQGAKAQVLQIHSGKMALPQDRPWVTMQDAGGRWLAGRGRKRTGEQCLHLGQRRKPAGRAGHEPKLPRQVLTLIPVASDILGIV